VSTAPRTTAAGAQLVRGLDDPTGQERLLTTVGKCTNAPQDEQHSSSVPVSCA